MFNVFFEKQFKLLSSMFSNYKCISQLNNSIFSQFVFLIFLRWISQQLRIMHYEL